MKDAKGALDMLKLYEGNYPYMYLDTRGYVTVGVGFMIPSAVAATAYPFYLTARRHAHSATTKGTIHSRPALQNPATSTPPDNKATANEVKAEWNKIHGKPGSHLATWYAKYSSMTLTNSEIDRLLQGKVNRFESRLKTLFSGWADFPAPAQNALLDMIFNVGSLAGFPTLCEAARHHDWAKCAAHCHRLGPSDARNNATRDRFLDAAKQQKPLVGPVQEPAGRRHHANPHVHHRTP